MSEERSQYCVIQNGNPFDDARLRLAPRGIQTVVDIGANVGDVCQHLIANFPESTIHAFEPDRSCFKELRTRFAANPRVKPVHQGVSDSKGTRTLHRYAETGLNALSALTEGSERFLSGYGVQSLGTELIELTTLDDYCQQQKIDRIDFLKMDVQGWELHCLRGCKRLLSSDRIGAIYSEVNFVSLYQEQVFYEDVAGMLRDYGYQLFSLYALSFSEERQLCWADALFVKVPGRPVAPRQRSLLSRFLART